MTMSAALYARYSFDQQRAASIKDQFRICREHAEREGWSVAGCYRDAAISGDSMIQRPGIQALLEDARRGLFEILVAEALDRVSRDQADVAALYKHLRFAGVTIVTLAEGEISELHVGLKRTADDRDRHILVGCDGLGGCGDPLQPRSTFDRNPGLTYSKSLNLRSFGRDATSLPRLSLRDLEVLTLITAPQICCRAQSKRTVVLCTPRAGNRSARPWRSLF